MAIVIITICNHHYAKICFIQIMLKGFGSLTKILVTVYIYKHRRSQIETTIYKSSKTLSFKKTSLKALNPF